MKVLVTGATGFVGRFLCERLLSAGDEVRGTLLPSENPAALAAGVEPVVVESLGENTSWSYALKGVDAVIHLAARVHIMDDPSADPLTEFRKVNTLGTKQLAREAAKAGVKRMVLISSVKVNGEESVASYSEHSPALPTDPYGISKWEAEQALWEVAAQTGMEGVVVRPPLVYGPGVKANFLKMMTVIQRGVPLPLASIRNKRSLVFVGNLVDALAVCAAHPAAAGKTYLVSDGDDVSTPELISKVASALGVSARMLPVPPAFMIAAGVLTGKRAAVDRLTGSLTVDSSSIRRDLDWRPPFTMKDGLQQTAAWFLKTAT